MKVEVIYIDETQKKRHAVLDIDLKDGTRGIDDIKKQIYRKLKVTESGYDKLMDILYEDKTIMYDA